MVFVGIAGLVGGLVSAVATPVIVAVLAGRIGRGRPVALSEFAGEIAPEPVSALITVAFGLLAAIAGLWGVIAGMPVVKIAGVCGIVLGLPLAAFMSPSLTRLHVVKWSEEGVEGPASLFGPTLGFSRTFIRWSELATSGETTSSYWFLQTSDGRRIYWSYLYRGHLAFRKSISTHCPGLTLPVMPA